MTPALPRVPPHQPQILETPSRRRGVKLRITATRINSLRNSADGCPIVQDLLAAARTLNYVYVIHAELNRPQVMHMTPLPEYGTLQYY